MAPRAVPPQHLMPPALAPGLSFIGLPWKVVPFPQFELQARLVARWVPCRTGLRGSTPAGAPGSPLIAVCCGILVAVSVGGHVGWYSLG